MKQLTIWIYATLLLGCALLMPAQQNAGSTAKPAVPQLVNYSGELKGQNGRPLTGQVSVTFSLYKQQEDQAPLWTEMQDVQTDNIGHYSVMLGSTSSEGLPSIIFVGGEPRWLGVQPEGQLEQTRVLLLSVPYALKAADAETLGGLPVSAFLTTASQVQASAPAAVISAPAASANPAVTPATAPTGSGTTDFVPLWTSSTNLGNSILVQSGSTMQVNGGLELPALGAATATTGKNSQPLALTASTLNSSTGKSVAQAFQWQAEPEGNDSSSPSATLNLLFSSGGAAPTETLLRIDHQGHLLFAPGQTFPGGTVNGAEQINGHLSVSGTGFFGGNNTSGILQVTRLGNGNALTGTAEGKGAGVAGVGAIGVSGIGLNNGTGVQGQGAIAVEGNGTDLGVLGEGSTSNSFSQGVVGVGQHQGVVALAQRLPSPDFPESFRLPGAPPAKIGLPDRAPDRSRRPSAGTHRASRSDVRERSAAGYRFGSIGRNP